MNGGASVTPTGGVGAVDIEEEGVGTIQAGAFLTDRTLRGVVSLRRPKKKLQAGGGRCLWLEKKAAHWKMATG